jgi:hypothetical protein
MTTIDTKFYFDPDTIDSLKYSTTTDRFNFVRDNCEYHSDEDFDEILLDLSMQIDLAEQKEMLVMINEWEKDILVIKYRHALRTIKVLELQLEMTRKIK